MSKRKNKSKSNNKNIFYYSILLLLLLCGCFVVVAKLNNNENENSLDKSKIEEKINEQIQQEIENNFVAQNFPSKIIGLEAKAIAASGYGSIVLLPDNSVKIWGLFHGSIEKEAVNVLFDENELIEISKITGGGYHGLALSNDGKVYAFGKNGHGQLGIQSNLLHGSKRIIKQTTQGDVHIVANQIKGDLQGKIVNLIAAGQEFSLAVAENGNELYAWGDNSRGQLGLNQTIQTIATPTLVENIDWQQHGGIIDVCAGGQHSFVLLGDGTVFATGASEWGATGLGQFGDTFTFQKVLFPQDVEIVDIACGGDHTLAKSKDGKLFASGWNEHGAVGIGHVDNVNQFEQVLFELNEENEEKTTSTPHHVTFISGGAYAHSLAITNDGRLWSWGLGEFGALGVGNGDDQLIPTRLPNVGGEVVAVDAGFKHSLALLADGGVLAFGDSMFGQIPELLNENEFELSDEQPLFDASKFLGFAMDANQRFREQQLDRIVIDGGQNAKKSATSSFAGVENALYIGVYDGHGDSPVVDVVTQSLHKAVESEWSNVVEQHKNSLQSGIIAAQQAFKKAYINVGDMIRNDVARSRLNGAVVSSTILQPLSCDQEIYAMIHFANIGDVSAFISKTNKPFKDAKQLGALHRAFDPQERERIEAAGGRVVRGRVNGILEPSRAFGDTLFPRGVVSYEPTTSSVSLIDSVFDVVVIGSDGLWDAVTTMDDRERMLSIARDVALSTYDAAQRIVDLALQRGSTDNVAVTVLRLDEWREMLCNQQQSTPIKDEL